MCVLHGWLRMSPRWPSVEASSGVGAGTGREGGTCRAQLCTCCGSRWIVGARSPLLALPWLGALQQVGDSTCGQIHEKNGEEADRGGSVHTCACFPLTAFLPQQVGFYARFSRWAVCHIVKFLLSTVVISTEGTLRRLMTNDHHPIPPFVHTKASDWTKQASGDTRTTFNELRWTEIDYRWTKKN